MWRGGPASCWLCQVQLLTTSWLLRFRGVLDPHSWEAGEAVDRKNDSIYQTCRQFFPRGEASSFLSTASAGLKESESSCPTKTLRPFQPTDSVPIVLRIAHYGTWCISARNGHLPAASVVPLAASGRHAVDTLHRHATINAQVVFQQLNIAIVMTNVTT